MIALPSILTNSAPAFALASLLLVAAPALYPQQDPSADATIKSLADVQKNWGAKMNSDGASITLKEMSRKRTSEGTAISYRLIGSGLPADRIYSILTPALDLQYSPTRPGVTLDAKGQAICAGKPGTCSGERPNDPIDITVFAARGEPKRFALASEDNELHAFAYVVPFPIIGKDKACTAEALLLMPNAQALLIHGTGFTPGGEIRFVEALEGETRERASKSDAEGALYEVAVPFVAGKASGKARVILQSSACNPSVSFDWGKDCCRNQ